MFKIDKITSVSGYAIIEVEETIVQEIEHGSLKLHFEGEYDSEDKPRYKNMRIWATVVSPPKTIRPTLFYEKEPGWPRPQGMKIWDPVEQKGKYYCSTFEPEYLTAADQEMLIRQGDKVYFHYLVLCDDNFMGRNEEGTMQLYKCSYERIFCAVREFHSADIKDIPKRIMTNALLTKKGLDDLGVPYETITQTIMLNGYILVQPYFGEGFEEVTIPELDTFGRDTGKTRTLKVKMKGGIIYDMNETPMFRQGTLMHCGDPLGVDHGLQSGDRIIYTHHSEFKNTIEGEEYFVMKQWDVVARVREDKIAPVGDYVLVDMEKKQKSNIILLEEYVDPKSTAGTVHKGSHKPTEGIVLDTGPGATEVEQGDKVRFDYSDDYILELPGLTGGFMKQSRIAWKELEEPLL